MSDPAGSARAIVEARRSGTLATLSDDGSPWASVVAYGLLPGGVPVLCVSTLAEHGRNLARDPRASLVVAAAVGPDDDPLEGARVTLAGRARRPGGGDEEAARQAFLADVPSAASYVGFADFSWWVLGVERVRWVAGFGRMATIDPEAYAAA
jgi:putative heme iron utilization protein